jgi:hypothetical protein
MPDNISNLNSAPESNEVQSASQRTPWTEGPWHAWDRGIGWEVHQGATCHDIDLQDPGYCEVINDGFRDTFTEQDAHLIAAAPDLYEALAEVVAQWGASGKVMKKAHAALAKARGNK